MDYLDLVLKLEEKIKLLRDKNIDNDNVFIKTYLDGQINGLTIAIELISNNNK